MCGKKNHKIKSGKEKRQKKQTITTTTEAIKPEVIEEATDNKQENESGSNTDAKGQDDQSDNSASKTPVIVTVTEKQEVTKTGEVQSQTLSKSDSNENVELIGQAGEKAPEVIEEIKPEVTKTVEEETVTEIKSEVTEVKPETEDATSQQLSEINSQEEDEIGQVDQQLEGNNQTGTSDPKIEDPEAKTVTEESTTFDAKEEAGADGLPGEVQSQTLSNSGSQLDNQDAVKIEEKSGTETVTEVKPELVISRQSSENNPKEGEANQTGETKLEATSSATNSKTGEEKKEEIKTGEKDPEVPKSWKKWLFGGAGALLLILSGIALKSRDNKDNTDDIVKAIESDNNDQNQ